MRFGTKMTTVLTGVVVLMWMASASAQQVRYFPDFSSGATDLELNGSAHLAIYNNGTVPATVLRLTNGSPYASELGSTWFSLPQPVNSGFTTYFRFLIHDAATCCHPRDGLAFVIQNSSATALGTGSLGGLGYQGIPNSMAVEFDTFQNPWDPNDNHVAVQSCGLNPNSANHTTNCLVGSNSGINSNIPHLGVTCGTSGPCADGTPHEVVIEYTPPASGKVNGTLMVWIDAPLQSGSHTPVKTAVPAINIPYNIDRTQNPTSGISLSGGTAWVGFTAEQTGDPQAQDILAWEFTPHTPTQVTQVIPPGGTPADYVFGGHDMGVTYFSGFTNDPDPYLMTITATPVPRNVFYKTRLLTQPGRPFINEQCVVYLQTGGNCIVYSVTCQRQSNPTVNVPCPSTNNCTLGDFKNCITYSTTFTTSDGITPQNADYLKAHVGQNDWNSVFVSFDPNIIDGKTTGTGGSSSDFVATFAVGAKP